jgi:hypothetical protein
MLVILIRPHRLPAEDTARRADSNDEELAALPTGELRYDPAVTMQQR